MLHDLPIRTLVIDDDLLTQFAHKKILESLDCVVETVSDGYEALKALKDNFDILMLDVYMPGITGLEVAKLIRSLKGKQPVIVGVTSDGSLKSACLEAGMNQMIQKPVTEENIAPIIEEMRMLVVAGMIAEADSSPGEGDIVSPKTMDSIVDVLQEYKQELANKKKV